MRPCKLELLRIACAAQSYVLRGGHIDAVTPQRFRNRFG